MDLEEVKELSYGRTSNRKHRVDVVCVSVYFIASRSSGAGMNRAKGNRHDMQKAKRKGAPASRIQAGYCGIIKRSKTPSSKNRKGRSRVVNLSDVKVPLFRSTAVVGDTFETRMSHEEIDAFHATALLFLIESCIAMPSVSLLVGTSGTSLVILRWKRVEVCLADVRAERAVRRVKNVLQGNVRPIGGMDFD